MSRPAYAARVISDFSVKTSQETFEGCMLHKWTAIAAILSLRIMWAHGLNMSSVKHLCPCYACKEIVREEFNNGLVYCNQSDYSCPCKFQVIDLFFCVEQSNQTEREYTVGITGFSPNLDSPYTSLCRYCYEQGGGCIMDAVVNSDVSRIENYEICLCTLGILCQILATYQIMMLDDRERWWLCGMEGWADDVVRGMPSLAIVGFTIGKLFPLKYMCQTNQCRKMVHNSVMTIACMVFDLAQIIGMYAVKEDSIDEKPDCSHPHYRIFGRKLGASCDIMLEMTEGFGLIVSFCWGVYELNGLLVKAPGKGTLVLGIVASALNFLVMILEFSTWYWFIPRLFQKYSQSNSDGQGSTVEIPPAVLNPSNQVA